MMLPEPEPLCRFSERLFFTTFSKPTPAPELLNHADPQPKPSIRVQLAPDMFTPPPMPEDNFPFYYFSIDFRFVYSGFFQDWGPLNLAMVYKACIFFHKLLEDEELSFRRLVLYASNSPHEKANAALLMALYVMIVQHRAPWEAFRPIAELEFTPFRDAGRGPSDFNLSIQDCLWGMWKAMQNGLCDMNDFSVEDYEFYEKVENGDWNWITPNFIAFASPMDPTWKRQRVTANQPSTPTRSAPKPKSVITPALQRKLPTSFLNCLNYFEERNVRLVVRLNADLYDKEVFLSRGIEHMELYFDDGTNPTDEIVRAFIDESDRVIENGGVVAVHCKAGLGRTGTLIGAYLIWKYGFTANEAIAFMRIARPGSVVGPQQQYLYLKQLEWVKWAAVDETRKGQTSNAGTPTPAQAMNKTTTIAAASKTSPNDSFATPATPPAETDDPDAMEDVQQHTPPPIAIPTSMSSPAEKPPLTPAPVTPSRHVAEAAARARAIATPGQPRKTPVVKRVRTLDSDDNHGDESDDTEDDVLPALEVGPAVRRARRTNHRVAVPMSEARPVRVTRSRVSAAALVRVSTKSSASTPLGSAALARSASPNKIPRMVATRSAAASRATVTSPPPSTAMRTGMTGRAPAAPSRLPLLSSSPTKRVLRHNATNSPQATEGTVGGGGIATRRKEVPKPIDSVVDVLRRKINGKNDAWVTKDAEGVVAPHPKTGRPGLRPIRRRRSSFSSADVVA